CSEQASMDKPRLRSSDSLCYLHCYFEKICSSSKSRQRRLGTFLPRNPRMDLPVRLALPNSPLTTGGSLDLQLEPAIMAWNIIPRPPLNRSRLLLLRSGRLEDRSRKSSNLRQPGPSVWRHNLRPPTQRKSQPMARSKLRVDSDRCGPRQQTVEEALGDEIGDNGDLARPSLSTSLNGPELGQRRRVAANSPRPRR